MDINEATEIIIAAINDGRDDNTISDADLTHEMVIDVWDSMGIDDAELITACGTWLRG